METKFGIVKEAYGKAEKAADLQAIYDLDDDLSELAFIIAEWIEIDIRDSFRIVWILKNDDEEEILKKIADHFIADDASEGHSRGNPLTLQK